MTFDLLRRFRSLATLAVLLVLLLIGVSWGWSKVTAPFPETGEEDQAICENATIAAGEKIYPDEVTVSVLNSGSRVGLASRTMQGLADRGFAEGQKANAPDGTNVARAQIWTDDPESAAVRLVATYLAKNGKNVKIQEREPTEVGINVVVGDKFTDVVKGRKAVTADNDTTICKPPAETVPDTP